MTKFNRKAIPLSLLLIGTAGSAWSAGFALLEQNASGAGTAYAGKAAVAEDASTAWFNPAGMTRLKRAELVVGLHAININAEFQNNGSETASGRTIGNDGGNPGGAAFVPNFHIVKPINEKTTFGFSLGVPFGLATDYAEGWVGRYQGLKSQIETIDLNPSLAMQVDENLSIGFGVSVQQLKAKLTQDIAYPFSGGQDGRVTIKGDSIDYGFNVGALLQAGPSTRLGLAYRSAIKHKLTGDVSFTNRQNLSTPVAAQFPDGELRSTVELPESLALSSVTQLSDRWDLMTDFTYTGWSSIQELRFDRVVNNGQPLPAQNYNWKNTMRYAAGASYKYNEKVKVRFGMAFDESPVPENQRKVRLADQDRIVLAVGSQYELSETCRIDLGFQFFKARNAPIDDNSEGQTNQYGRVKGNYKADAQILSAQFTHRF